MNQEKNRSFSWNEIAAKAYEIYVTNGCQEGRQAEDWFQAELELKSAIKNEMRNDAKNAVKGATKEVPPLRPSDVPAKLVSKSKTLKRGAEKTH